MTLFLTTLLLIALILIYILVISPWLRKRGLSAAQLQLVDLMAIRAVAMAEQHFLTGRLAKDERKKAALKAAAEMLQLTGMVPERFMDTIDNLVESAVRELPKTNLE